MPRGIYPRKNGKKQVVENHANPIQVLADEVVALRKKAMTAKPSKQLILAQNKARLRAAEYNQTAQQYIAAPKQVTEDEQMREENEMMKEHLSQTRRVLSDRINTIILLLENLKASL